MERLDSRVRVEWLVRALLVAAVVGAVTGVGAYVVLDGQWWVGAVAFLLLALAGAALLVLRYRVWGYEVRPDELYIERGVLTRVQTLVPYVRVQHVDSRRGPVERALGLASVVVYTAGSRGADVRIPGLSRERAESLQRRLRDLAIESEPDDAV